jgi:hypothetical protein
MPDLDQRCTCTAMVGLSGEGCRCDKPAGEDGLCQYCRAICQAPRTRHTWPAAPLSPEAEDFIETAKILAEPYNEDIQRLRAELCLTEGDLTVAVAEAQRARGERDELRDAMVALQSLPSTAELLRLRAQRRAVLDLCDQAEYAARTERDLGSGLDGSGVVWIGDIRTALGAADE